MENSRIAMLTMALPLVILILSLVITLYTVGFDLEAATLPENPVGPLNETVSSLLQAEEPFVTGSAIESDPAAGTINLTGTVRNPTAYPLTMERLEYRIRGEGGNTTASMAGPVTIAPKTAVEVVLTGDAEPGTLGELRSGQAEGTLVSEITFLGVRITAITPRPWKVEA